MKANEIKRIAEKYRDEWAVVGIRTQYEEFKLGEINHKSYIWDDDEMTEEMHTGISVTNIFDESNAVAMHAEDYDDRGYYHGEHIAIIVGDDYYYGQDEGEFVLQDAIVVEILK